MTEENRNEEGGEEPIEDLEAPASLQEAAVGGATVWCGGALKDSRTGVVLCPQAQPAGLNGY